jgi:hypothetical protein
MPSSGQQRSRSWKQHCGETVNAWVNIREQDVPLEITKILIIISLSLKARG